MSIRMDIPQTPPQRRKGLRLLLALAWLSGWLCGLLLAFLSDDFLISLMRGTLTAPVSIVRLLGASTLPFLISAFAVFLLRPILLPVCFLRAFLSGLFAGGLMRAFGPSAWLLRFFLMFGDTLTAPILYWFWLRGVERRCRPSFWETAACISAAILIGSVDYRFISPFLARLIES